MLGQPPKLSKSITGDKILRLLHSNEVGSLVASINKDYLYWDKVKYLPRPASVTLEELWACVIMSRAHCPVFRWCGISITVPSVPFMQERCHAIDMNFGGTWGGEKIKEQDRQKYLISSIMEEAISSSQIEGASTTRKIAKAMLRSNRTPKTRSERMIYNNYVSIRYIVAHKDETLSVESLCELHRLMTQGTLDDPKDEGRFREGDDIHVVNSENGEIVHTPPLRKDLPKLAEGIIEFFNAENGGTKDSLYVHPIIRAIMLHFMIAYLHPFVDGNGRTARALFYWYMIRNGYWLIQYISISSVIYKSKTGYEKSFLYTEATNNDLGYFIKYNLDAIDKAFSALRQYIERKQAETRNVSRVQDLYHLNKRQAEIYSEMCSSPNDVYSAHDMAARYGVSHQTAMSDLRKLQKCGLAESITVNLKETNFKVCIREE